MAKTKKAIDKHTIEIRKLLEEEKLIIGTERTLKGLKNGKLVKVYQSVNCHDEVKESIIHYSKLGNLEVIETE